MDNDDEFGADADFLSALASSDVSTVPPRVSQPTPQRLDRPPPSNTNTLSTGSKVVQPTPQVIGSRSSGSTIQVSARQKGNPILTNLRSFAWEYADIPADYGLGLTTCALFLSLKYHRLHPEYIYNRIKGLAGKYNLRVILTMVDIGNHEESLKELSKTSLVNNVTIVLCWSASEAARYLELYKSYEHANPTAIRGTESRGYAEKMVDFVTVPRSINKTDAVSLVSAFGSVRAAVNAGAEEIGVVGGWGEKKVSRWCGVVEEPFRARKAAKRGLVRDESVRDGDGVGEGVFDRAIPLSRVALRDMGETGGGGNSTSQERDRDRSVEPRGLVRAEEFGADDKEALLGLSREEAVKNGREGKKEVRSRKDTDLGVGVADALAKLRDNT